MVDRYLVASLFLTRFRLIYVFPQSNRGMKERFSSERIQTLGVEKSVFSAPLLRRARIELIIEERCVGGDVDAFDTNLGSSKRMIRANRICGR